MEKLGSLLIVEDDEDIREMISMAGVKHGYAVRSLRNGLEARNLLSAGDPPDIVILDINMPGMDGYTFCRWVREVYPRLPIIFLSARSNEYDKILALEIGGDDYLTKPFSMGELFARIAVGLRRVNLYENGDRPGKTESIQSGDLELFPASWTCIYQGQDITFSVSEFRIMRLLIESPGRVYTREQLGRAAFPEDKYYSGRGVDVHIARIRKKLQTVDPAFAAIETQYRAGYRWRR